LTESFDSEVPKYRTSRFLITRWDLIPFITYVLFLPALQNKENSVWFGFAASMITMVVILICDGFRRKKKDENIKYCDSPEKNITSSEKTKIREIIHKYDTNAEIDFSSDDEVEIMVDKKSKLAKKGMDDEVKKYLEKKFDITVDMTIKGRSGGMQAKNIMLIFSGLYVIIGGVAITHGFDTFLGSSDDFKTTHTFWALSHFLSSPETILFLSFISLAILYYHCGLIYLSNDAIGALTRHQNKSRSEQIIFANVIMIFAESIILYFIADSIQDFSRFIIWVGVLMSIDIVWISVQRFAFKEKGTLWKNEIPFEWLHFSLIILFFMIILVQISATSDASWLLLVVLGTRTIIDYLVNWGRVWGRFKAIQ
jgi:hypothetical protein